MLTMNESGKGNKWKRMKDEALVNQRMIFLLLSTPRQTKDKNHIVFAGLRPVIREMMQPVKHV